MIFAAGIDFGTTNTTAAIAGSDGLPQIVPLAGHSIIPTTMFFEKETNQFFWGDKANEKYINAEEGRFLRSLKRVLGTDLMKVGTLINSKNQSYQAIIGAFIKNVKSEIDAAAGHILENVVMGRPVHFRDGDSLGDKRAESELTEIAKIAGFKNVLFQYEPIAAAFAHERNLDAEQLAVVIDIGGGTSDFTILRLGPERIGRTDRSDDIMANTGIRIGGNDFDKQLSLDAFMPEFGMGTLYGVSNKILPVPISHYFDMSEWSRVNSLYTYKEINLVQRTLMSAHSPDKYGRLLDVIEKQMGHRVLNSVEDAKISLSDKDTVNIKLDFLSGESDIFVTRAQFEKVIENQTIKILTSVHECINLASINPDAVGLIVLTGGSTMVPYIRNTLCNVFSNATVSDGDRMSSVGLGLALDAGRRFKV